MANLRRREDGAYPVTLDEFKMANPNTSFGDVIVFEDFGHDVVFETARPDMLADLDRLVELAPKQDKKTKVWSQVWRVQDRVAEMTADEVVTVTAQYKAAVCGRIEDHRYTVETSGIMRAGTFIPTDRASQTNTANALIGIQMTPGMTIPWKTFTGNTVDADVEFLQELYRLMFQFTQACRAYEKTMCDAVKALPVDDPRAVLTFDYTQGWPT